ncbi:unnamed protein product [Echinostoma caproni]|uniref:CLU_N domain-containing protein n=1 Tax=Echinostoma caproni TaxID=27848 RepID=A0A183BFI4_9TREM|nr:unnamed protein product [Echinostoma caproni]
MLENPEDCKSNVKDDLKGSDSIIKNTENGEKTEGELMEDAPYTIKVIPSHAEPFELQVSSFELVQEIHRVLMDREETCSCTCFSLTLNGQTLDMFAELKAVEGLSDGAEIRVVEERYSVREAKNHVKHVHDLLYSIEPYDAYAGREQMSLCFVNVITGDLVEFDKAVLFSLVPEGVLRDALSILANDGVELLTDVLTLESVQLPMWRRCFPTEERTQCKYPGL